MKACDTMFDGGYACARPDGHGGRHESCGGHVESTRISQQNPDGTWSVSIPEPFWVRRWFRWKPACYPCKTVFKTRDDHDDHWLRTHATTEAT